MIATPFDQPLPAPLQPPDILLLSDGPLRNLRNFVLQHASEAGLGDTRANDLALGAHEVAVNSLKHGGGQGSLRVWVENRTLICEVEDAGHIGQPVLPHERPDATREHGRGLWLANQLCDLVQIRSLPTGSVVRLHMRLP